MLSRSRSLAEAPVRDFPLRHRHMSRFLKNATFPILIVVVLAFFAQRFLGQDEEKPKPNFGQFLTQVENGQVKSGHDQHA